MGDERILELVALAQTGHRDAWEELVRLVAPSLAMVARGLRPRKEDCEDLVQEALIRILKGIRTFEAAKGAFRTWAVDVLRNAAVDEHRRKQAQKRRVETVGAFEVSLAVPVGEDGDEELVELVADPAGRTPEQVHETRDLLARVADVVGRMPNIHREAFVLCVGRDLSPADAAAILGTTPGNVHVRLHRALRLIREQLAAHLDDTGGGE